MMKKVRVGLSVLLGMVLVVLIAVVVSPLNYVLSLPPIARVKDAVIGWVSEMVGRFRAEAPLA